MNGLCPACRTPYADNPHAFSPQDKAEIIKNKKERKRKEREEREKVKAREEERKRKGTPVQAIPLPSEHPLNRNRNRNRSDSNATDDGTRGAVWRFLGARRGGAVGVGSSTGRDPPCRTP